MHFHHHWPRCARPASQQHVATLLLAHPAVSCTLAATKGIVVHLCLCSPRAVVLWDLSEVLDDTLTCAYMKQVCVCVWGGGGSAEKGGGWGGWGAAALMPVGRGPWGHRVGDLLGNSVWYYLCEVRPLSVIVRLGGSNFPGWGVARRALHWVPCSAFM